MIVAQDIRYSKNVVGCRIKDKIYLHPELYKYPELYHAVLKHEIEHSDGWKLKDLQHDLFGDDLDGVKNQFYRFMIRHPRTFLGYLPLTKVGKTWAFDLPIFLIWMLGIAVFGLLLWGMSG